MTPDQVMGLIEPWMVAVMFVWGVVVKQWPKLKNIPNDTIGWMNVGIFVLAKLAGVETANAATGDVASCIGCTAVGAVTNAGLAWMLYEFLGRSILGRIFKKKEG